MWHEVPSVIVTVTSLRLVGPKRNPAHPLVLRKFDDARLDRAVEDFEAIQGTLSPCLRRFAHNVFDDDKPTWSGWDIGTAGERLMAGCVNE